MLKTSSRSLSLPPSQLLDERVLGRAEAGRNTAHALRERRLGAARLHIRALKADEAFLAPQRAPRVTHDPVLHRQACTCGTRRVGPRRASTARPETDEEWAD